MNAIVEQLLAGEGREAGQADIILEAASWAAAALAKLRQEDVVAILRAVAEPPVTEPSAAIVSTVTAALAQRSAIVIALHPGTPSALVQAARAIAAAAEQAGAPACMLQVIEGASPALTGHLMKSPRVNTILDTHAEGDGPAVPPEIRVKWIHVAVAGDPGAAAGRLPPVLGREAPMSLGKLQEGAAL
jgi:hypothetical protein